MLRQTALILFFFFLATIFSAPVNAIYDPLSVSNNKYGIHILETTELPKASELVNSSGGEWGYVTIPIRSNERDVEKWTKFMQEAKKQKLIPILRIASYPVGDHWMAPNEWDLVDFANFLDQLPWPTKNRYVMIYNEPNHQGEWGGFVYPEEYARVLDRAIDIFHKKNQDYFVITGGMDSAAPNGSASMDNITYLERMEAYIPGIFKKIDGFSTHAYGNPAFSTAPNARSPMNIKSYLQEEALLKTFGVENPKLFITEAGWHKSYEHYEDAFKNYWTEENIVAITPFILSAQAGPFEEFSFTDKNGQLEPFAKSIQKISKVKGLPQIADQKTITLNKIQKGIDQKIKNTNTNFEDVWSKILNFFSI